MLHKQFKSLYSSTNKHIDQLAPQLLSTSVQFPRPSTSDDDADTLSSNCYQHSPSDDDHVPVTTSSWSQSYDTAVSVVSGISGKQHPSSIVTAITRLQCDNVKTCRRHKRLDLCTVRTSHENLNNSSLFAGPSINAKGRRHDAVCFLYNNCTTYCVIEGIFAHYDRSITANHRILLIRLLVKVDPDSTNALVVTQFGNLRYKYQISEHGFVSMILVESSSILHPIVIVVDPYWLKLNLEVHALFDDVSSNEQNDKSIHFFRILRFNNYKRTQQLGSST